jgi:hypothetical protein
MNEHGVVRVRKTVTVTPWFEDNPMEIQAGWEGALIAQADTDTPCIEFTHYRETPIIVDLNVENLEVVWTIEP